MIQGKCVMTVSAQGISGFREILTTDKNQYEEILKTSDERGCEYSFANLLFWGKKRIAFSNKALVIHSQYNEKSSYFYPIGCDRINIVSALIQHAKENGSPLRFFGLLPSEVDELKLNYPNEFEFKQDEGTFDYIYEIEALANLNGKKLHAKRNHIHRFCENHPDFKSEQINENNLADVQSFLKQWFFERETLDPSDSYTGEKKALEIALANLNSLELESLILRDHDEILALTIGSRVSDSTFDIHFEKAKSGEQGAYAVINREFAKYLNEKYPDVKYLNREEDMGIEGLRKAKQSYLPCRQIQKFSATLLGI